ncbi:hypothetical protein RRG08_012898 [Elysia crispata]|uniref:Uncharacterized protein n=1 Tax=Elysia crispata TaxID=231223 RepID=A0AAE0YHC7_9GAST|nr:hypothetical protein RRG08_012898 [Elysia crispata]
MPGWLLIDIAKQEVTSLTDLLVTMRNLDGPRWRKELCPLVAADSTLIQVLQRGRSVASKYFLQELDPDGSAVWKKIFRE